ncbi:ribonuclease HI family protein [Ardenticatena maritima]|nr:ribonuclease HI family protein [Ardenticatena maritima]
MSTNRMDDILARIRALSEEERRTLFARLWQENDLAEALRAAQHLRPAASGAATWPQDVHYVLIFDGGSKGNPGKGYGSAMLVRTDTGQRKVQRFDFEGSLTNNEAEYKTLIEAVRLLLDKIRAHGKDPAAYRLEVRGDSDLVVQQLSGRWKARDARMAALRDEALALLNQFGGWRITHHDRSNSVHWLGH